jgi:hypothetical protein
MEKWLNEIKGYEQLKGYKILDNGILLSYWNKGAGNERKSYLMDLPIELNNPLDRKGYIRNTIGGRNNYSKEIRRHVLVAKAFILNPNNYIQVGHKDGNKQNNHVSNLEWCNNSMNQQNSYKIGEKQLKYKEDQIKIMCENWGKMSVDELSKLCNINKGSMYDIYKGKAIMYTDIVSKYK